MYRLKLFVITSLVIVATLFAYLVHFGQGEGRAPEPVQEIKYIYRDGRGDYEVQLLQLVLDLTEQEYGKAQVVAIHNESLRDYPSLAQAQGVIEEVALLVGVVDVAGFTPNRRKNENLIHVEVPLRQGMLGYRLLLTNAESEKKIAASLDREHFRQYVIGGMMLYWDDYRIFTHNGFTIKTTTAHQPLFEMAASGAIDYFASGLNEVFRDIQQNRAKLPELMISPSVALYYPLDYFFYTDRLRPELAERLTKGLAEAERSGKYQQFLSTFYAENIAQLKEINPKRVYYLENPDYKAVGNEHFAWWLDRPLPTRH